MSHTSTAHYRERVTYVYCTLKRETVTHVYCTLQGENVTHILYTRQIMLHIHTAYYRQKERESVRGEREKFQPHSNGRLT